MINIGIPLSLLNFIDYFLSPYQEALNAKFTLHKKLWMKLCHYVSFKAYKPYSL